jgi:uncharacterized protein
VDEMKAQLAMEIPYNSIKTFCHKWNVQELSLFGSVLRKDFRLDSDVDVLVTFAPNAKKGLFELTNMQNELQSIFGRQVDLVSKRSIEASRNYLRRENILNSAEVIYDGQ